MGVRIPQTISFGCNKKYRWSRYSETDTTVTYENAFSTSNGGCLEYVNDFGAFQIDSDLPSMEKFTPAERECVDNFQVYKRNLYAYQDPTDQRFSMGPSTVAATEPYFHLRLRKDSLQRAIEKGLVGV